MTTREQPREILPLPGLAQAANWLAGQQCVFRVSLVCVVSVHRRAAPRCGDVHDFSLNDFGFMFANVYFVRFHASALFDNPKIHRDSARDLWCVGELLA